MRCLIAGLVAIAGCGTSSPNPGAGAPVTGSSAPAASSASNAPTGSNAPPASDAASAPTGSNAPPASDAASAPTGSSTPIQTPAKLELQAEEKRHDPPVETAWNVPGGTVTATVVDVTPSGKADHPITKLVVWGNGKRYDIVKTASVCDADAELRHVIDSRIVFHCAIRPVGDEPEARIEDWLIRWSEEKNAPLRNRHWRGDPADPEPKWAASPKPKTGRSHKKPASDHQCCCEATMDNMTTHGWEQASACKSDPDNELSATCVEQAKCRGIKAD